jgi:hypothetical protein
MIVVPGTSLSSMVRSMVTAVLFPTCMLPTTTVLQQFFLALRYELAVIVHNSTNVVTHNCIFNTSNLQEMICMWMLYLDLVQFYKYLVELEDEM